MCGSVDGVFSEFNVGWESGSVLPQHTDIKGASKADAVMKNFLKSSIVGCRHNEDQRVSIDDIFEHLGNAEFGSAWRDWCDMTRSDRDPVSGSDRNDGNGENINSTDR